MKRLGLSNLWKVGKEKPCIVNMDNVGGIFQNEDGCALFSLNDGSIDTDEPYSEVIKALEQTKYS